MLSDEEKKAIEDFKECYEKDISRYEDFNTYTQYIVKRNELILNLIEKQSKEIEELKEKNEYLPNWVSKKYVSKDKIKAKIEEVEQWELYNMKIGIKYILQSLLEKE